MPIFAGAPRRRVELHAGVAVALDQPLDPDEEVGPDRLRAGIAAPGAADGGGDEEQPEPGHDQQAGDVIEFLRPDLDEEEVEAAVGEVDQHRLVGRIGPAVPAQPGRDLVDAEGDRHDHPFEAAENALGALREDLDRAADRAPAGLRRLTASTSNWSTREAVASLAIAGASMVTAQLPRRRPSEWT